MTHTIYGVCKRCGRIVKKEETTMNSGETDGKSYVSVESKYCGCGSKQQPTDVAKGQ